MCIAKVAPSKCKSLNRSSIGREVQGVLNDARAQHRLICGLIPAIKFLEKCPGDTLLCLLPQISPDDPTTHMQTVLLQAYCFENYIPVIQVDNAERLAQLCGILANRSRTSECFCAVITTDLNAELNPDEDPPLSPSEQLLTDFYECTLEENPRPVIELPSYVET